MGKLDREVQAEVSAGEAEFVTADLVKETGSIAEDDGNTGNGIPDDIPKSPQACERRRDFIPVGMKGEVLRGADGDEALSIRHDGARVDRINRKGSARGQGLRQGDGGFVELARAVGIGIQRGNREGDVMAGNAYLFPVERGGNLERDTREWGFA